MKLVIHRHTSKRKLGTVAGSVIVALMLLVGCTEPNGDLEQPDAYLAFMEIVGNARESKSLVEKNYVFYEVKDDSRIGGAVIHQHLTQPCQYEKCYVALFVSNSILFFDSITVACSRPYGIGYENQTAELHIFMKESESFGTSNFARDCFTYETHMAN